MAAQRDVIVRIKADYRAFQADMKAAARSAKQASEEIDKAGKKSSSAFGTLMLDAQNHEESWDRAGGALMGFGASVIAMVGVSVAKYAAFDKAMSRVEAATHASASDMDLLRDAAIRAGADTAFSAEEAAQGIEELAKAGVSTADILDGGLNGALSLAAAGELAVADAAEIAASALTQFKLAGDQIPHLADLLAAGAGKAQGSVSDLGAALNQSGLVAASTGLTIEETTGALAAFASAGLTGSDAGTSFKSMLQRLTPQSTAAQKEMEALGISAYDSQGSFIGMSEFAGVLQEAFRGVDDESRNASMGIIFGSDAVRASTILFEQGAEGIEKWEDAVNQAGYAAQTAAIMQDNLAGDVEKLGGAFDTVFIQAGGGVNDMLRKLVSGAEDLVDALGKLSPEALSTIASIAGIVGVTALAGGAFLKLAPKVIETWTSFRSLGTEGGKLPGKLGKVAKAAGIAGIAIAGMQIIGTIITQEHTKTTTDYAEAVMRVAEAGEKASAADLDSLFDEFSTVGGGDRVSGIRDLAGAVAELSNPSFGDGLNKNLNFMNGWFGLPSDKLTLLEERLGDFGQTLGELATSGDAQGAADAFRLVADEYERNGKSAQDALDVMPEYGDALTQLALNAGHLLTDQERLTWALEGVAPAAVEAAKGAEEMETGLAEIGLAADGAVESLDKLLESMFAAGLATMSSRDAAFAWENTLRDTKTEIDEILKSQGKLGKALNKNADDFNMSTDSGEAANTMFQDMARQGLEVAEVFSKDVTKSQEDVQKQLTSTYDGLVKTAEGFGMGTEEAIALTREVLQVPKGVDIKTWISDSAKNGAKETAEEVMGIPDMKGVKVIVTDEGTVKVTDEQIQGIKDRTKTVTVVDGGTVMEVQGGINNITGKTEHVFVDDAGTVRTVQGHINSVTGKTEYVYVDDDGTVRDLQGDIYGVKDGQAKVNVTESGLSWVQTAINSVKDGYAKIFVKSIYSNDRPAATGPGGSGGPTRAKGGRAPGLADGGRVPATGLGTDKVMGVNQDGVPHVWVDDREWVINRKSSDEYDRELAMINAGTFPKLRGLAGGGQASFAAPAFTIPQSQEVARYAAQPASQLSGDGGLGAVVRSLEVALAAASSAPRPIVLQVENMTVDGPDRVKELSQELWSRAQRADRAAGKANLRGVTA